MDRRLKLAKKLLNPKDSVLIVTIDEKEYLHLGCLLEEIFPEAQIQTLVNFLDISIDDISKYIIKNYVNAEALALEITEILKSKLNKNIEE